MSHGNKTLERHSMKSCLVNEDSYNGVWQSQYNWVDLGSIIPYIKQPSRVLITAQIDICRLFYVGWPLYLHLASPSIRHVAIAWGRIHTEYLCKLQKSTRLSPTVHVTILKKPSNLQLDNNKKIASFCTSLQYQNTFITWFWTASTTLLVNKIRSKPVIEFHLFAGN